MEIGLKHTALTNNKSKILSHLDLSIQLGLNGLSFCILQKDTNTISCLKHFEFDRKQSPFEVLDTLKDLFETEVDLQKTFDSVIVIYVNELSTLVPKPLFNEDNLADYLKFNSKILKSDFIAFDEIAANDSVNVYVPYANINNYIFEKFGSFTYKHFSTILIESILNFEKNTEKPKVYINISSKHFEVIITEAGQLKFYNTFDYTSKEDFIYYILFTAEQLSLNPETVNVILLGDVQHDNELYNIAYKYIRYISFGSRQDAFNFEIEPIPDHTNFVILKSF